MSILFTESHSPKKYDFAEVKTIDTCDEIASECHRLRRWEQLYMIIDAIATPFFTYIVWSSLPSIGLLVLAASIVGIYSFIQDNTPLPFLAIVVPVITVAFVIREFALVLIFPGSTLIRSGNATYYGEQAELAVAHKASLLERKITPVGRLGKFFSMS